MFDATVQAIRITEARPRSSHFQPFAGTTRSAAVRVGTNGSAWDEGYLAAKAEADADHRALLTMIAAAEAFQPEPSEELAALIAETVLRLVTEIVGAVEIDHETLLKRAKRAAALISDTDAARTMWVHPDDVEVLQDSGLSLSIMADPAADRGSIRIDCSPGWIEHGTSLYLDALRSGLGLKERET